MKLPAWGQRNNEGPPDLDEVFRDLNQKLNQLFGGKRGNGSGQPPTDNKPLELPLIPIVLIILGIWLATGYISIQEGTVGVKQRFGKYVDVIGSGPNWHWPFPIESVTEVNMEEVRRLEVGYRSTAGGGKAKVSKEALMLTEDENIIDLQIQVQYNLKNAKDFLFNNKETEAAVKSAAETILREYVGKNKLDDLLQNKVDLEKTSENMQVLLDSYKAGVNITSVSLQAAFPPSQVQEAFEDVNRANQDYQRKINEGQAYANTLIPEARGRAARLKAEAEGYKLRVENEAHGNADRFNRIYTEYVKAPEVTRKRLYIEAQEQILSSVSKVVVDQKAGGNSLMYLPLDKLINTTTVDEPAKVNSSTTASDMRKTNEVSQNTTRGLQRSRPTRGGN